MDKFEEKIIDLIDVIAEPEQLQPDEPLPPMVPKEKETSFREIAPTELVTVVREEVKKILKERIDAHLQNMIREMLAQEIEKAIAREIESLKRQ
jgi:hypothetical protein